MKENLENAISTYLEITYAAAKLRNDTQMILRLKRAILAFTADTESEIFKEKFLKEHNVRDKDSNEIN